MFWSVDPNTSAGGYCAQDTTIWRHWLRELGIQRVFIDPYCNATAAHVGEKWIAPRPGTDAALAEAIAYVWIKEGTYDKWFVENRTVGFEEFKAHILGETDGQPRTPQWASKICDVPAHTITALAREWASKKTMLACGAMYGTGGACREAYATEWARLMVILIAMQGIGKPGVNIWGGVAMERLLILTSRCRVTLQPVGTLLLPSPRNQPSPTTTRLHRRSIVYCCRKLS